ncbi:MAG: low molecular weight protein tyrosine phosphatase family protein [Akkermansiaceae bacterium]
MIRILFICSRNKLRSPTAEFLFAGRQGVEVDSAGVSNDAEVLVSEDQIEWADLILVMEQIHRRKLTRRMSQVLGGKKISVLGIPDDYKFMDPELIEILESKCSEYLP